MDNKEFSKKLEEITRKFAINIIKLSAILPNTPEGRVIRNQITKSECSIGANYREANRAKSKADFLNKIKISEGEASETVYWIEIITELNWIEKTILTPIYNEATEILAIFTSISNKVRRSISA